MLSFRSTALSLGALAGLLLAGPAFAADVIIEQTGTPNALGSWVLRGPDARTWHGNDATQTVVVNASGAYTLNVLPPSGAPDVIITLEAADGTTITETRDLSLTASLASDRSYRFVVVYDYESFITIESAPRGAPYSLEDVRGRVVASGTTPDQVTVPSGTYTAKYGFVRGCAIPKPQSRSTGRGERVHFFGRYECAGAAASVASRSASSRSSVRSARSSARSSVPVGTGDVSLWLRPQQREAVPGGTAVYSLGIRNDGSVTQHDLVVRFKIDKTMMSFQEVPTNGAIIGSGRMLSWRLPELAPGQSWTVQFPVRVNENIRTGTRLEAIGSVEGPNVANGETSEEIRVQTTAATIGIAMLPATGAAMDLWFVGVTALGALLLTFENRRRQSVA